jgi:hypothetical protein
MGRMGEKRMGLDYTGWQAEDENDGTLARALMNMDRAARA